jgi:hypothetical protein
MITISLCIASAVILSLAGMLICAGGNLTFAGPFLLPAGIGFIILALAVRFPRTVAFPLFLVSGLLVVWLGYAFLRFPRIAAEGTPLALVHQGPDKTLLIHFAYYTRDDDETEILTIEDDSQAPEFSASLVHFDERYPLIGGEDRGALTRISRVTKNYYTHRFPVAEKNPLGISFQSCHTEPGPLPSGINFLVLFDGKTLNLRPSGQLIE